MQIFARSSHYGRALHWSDFVSIRDGHAVYHLIPLLLLVAVVATGLFFLRILLSRDDYITIPVTPGCFTAAVIVLLLILMACCILTRFTAFVWF